MDLIKTELSQARPNIYLLKRCGKSLKNKFPEALFKIEFRQARPHICLLKHQNCGKSLNPKLPEVLFKIEFRQARPYICLLKHQSCGKSLNPRRNSVRFAIYVARSRDKQVKPLKTLNILALIMKEKLGRNKLFNITHAIRKIKIGSQSRTNLYRINIRLLNLVKISKNSFKFSPLQMRKARGEREPVKTQKNRQHKKTN